MYFTYACPIWKKEVGAFASTLFDNPKFNPIAHNEASV